MTNLKSGHEKKFVLVYFIDDNSYSVMKESLVHYDDSKSTAFVYYSIKRKQQPFSCIVIHKGSETECDKKYEEILKTDKYVVMLFEKESSYEVIKKSFLIKEKKDGSAYASFLIGKKHELVKGITITEGTQEECAQMCSSSNQFYNSFNSKTAIDQIHQKINFDKIFKRACVDTNAVDLDTVFKKKNLNKTYLEDNQFMIEQ